MIKDDRITTALAEIEQFVRWCIGREHVDGFNIYCGKDIKTTHILAKNNFDPKPLYALTFNMDYADPVERPLIINALNKGMTGQKELPADFLENEMVAKSEDDKLNKQSKSYVRSEN